jgi:hypothetical protein
MPWLAGRLALDGRGWSEAAAALAIELAAAEPPARPDPDDPRAVSWKVPGPGGHVRHYLAVRASSDDGPPGKRAWLVHCIEETDPPDRHARAVRAR